jgi:HEAT repeat protein
MNIDEQAAAEPGRADAEIERAILVLQSPFGDAPDLREHARIVQFLLEHADRAHPRLLDLLRSGQAANPYAVIEILPRFARPESIPVLEQLAGRDPQNLASAAALALATHPLDDARQALLRGLTASREGTVIAVADALMTRRDPSACGKLSEALGHPNDGARYHTIQAAASLGCLKPEALSAIASGDASEAIRELARRLAAAGQGENR